MLAGVVSSDWSVWETRLWDITGQDPRTLTARQLLSLVYGWMMKDRSPQDREELDAMLEDRPTVDLETGQPKGLKSADPDERTRARLAVVETRRREAEGRSG